MLALMPLLLSTVAFADPPAPDHVALTFGWRVGMKAVVTATEVRDNGAGPLPATALSAALEVRDAGEGALELRWSKAKQSKARKDPTLAVMLSAFHGTMPAEKVDATGAWKGLVDPDTVRLTLAKITDMMSAKLAGDVGDDPNARAALDLQRTVLEHTLSPQVMSGRTEKSWNDEVGFWLGADLELGKLYEFDADQATPSGGTLKSHIAFRALERAPCAAFEGAPSCVRLTLHTESDPDTVRAMTLQVMQPALAAMGLPADALTEARDESTLVVLVEPSTLRPWSAATEQRTTVTVDAHEPSGRQTTTRVTTRTKSWAWK